MYECSLQVEMDCGGNSVERVMGRTGQMGRPDSQYCACRVVRNSRVRADEAQTFASSVQKAARCDSRAWTRMKEYEQ